MRRKRLLHKMPQLAGTNKLALLLEGKSIKIAVMKKTPIAIQLDHQGIHYDGWVTPSTHVHDDGLPKSYRLELNQALFGNLSHNRGKWMIDEPRPQGLVVAVGTCLDRGLAKELKK